LYHYWQSRHRRATEALRSLYAFREIRVIIIEKPSVLCGSRGPPKKSTMRTSGASTETTLIIAVVCVAVGILVILAGGPGEVLRVLDGAVHSVGDALFKAYQHFRA
jgi:hypothetical protein